MTPVLTSIMLVTCNRPQLFAECFTSLLVSLAQEADWELLVHVTALEGPYNLPEREGVSYYQEDNLISANQAYSALLEKAQGEYLTFLADDCMFGSKWLSIAQSDHRQQFPNGVGLLAYNDGMHDGLHASHAFMTRKTLEVLYGKVRFPDEYEHCFADTELVHATKSLGCYGYAPGSIVTHRHPANGSRAFDSTDALHTLEKYMRDSLRFKAFAEKWNQQGVAQASERLQRE